MRQHQEQFTVNTRGKGLYEITDRVRDACRIADVKTGLCTVFICHTSASLVIMENADPSAIRDLENFFDRLVPEDDPSYSHTAEGPDDMPSHIRSVLTATSLGIPVSGKRTALGTWQGVFVWEHRQHSHQRQIVVHVTGS